MRQLVDGIRADATERSWAAPDAAELLDSILDSATEHAIVAVDTDGTIVAWNAGAERLYGYRAAEALGCSIATLSRSLTDAWKRSAEIEADVAGSGRWEGTVAVRRPDGSEVTTRVVVSARLDASGNRAGYLCVCRDKAADLTDLMGHMRRVLRAVVDRDDSKARIAAGIHDDTVQVMAAVGLKMQMAAKKATDPELAAMCSVIADEVSDAMTRLRDLMFELRPPEAATREVRAVLQTLVDEIGREAGFRGHVWGRLRTEPSDEDITTIWRISREAFNNVAKHSGAKRVHVRVHEFARGILVQIRDDGAGFEVGDGYSPAGHLGLTAMREAAAQADGWLEIESTSGEGTTVEFWVPLQAAGGAEPS